MHVPLAALRRQLTALRGMLDKAEAFAQAKSVDPAVMLGLRLAPDMFPFSRQVQVAADHARLPLARLQGREPERWPDDEATFEELRARIDRTLAALDQVPEGAFEGAEAREVTLRLRSGERRLSGEDYLWGFALPNFYFHLTAAYAILRANGVELGKRDFLGA